jgi:hypothetical protein
VELWQAGNPALNSNALHSIRSQQSKCANALTQWLGNSEGFLEGYEELRAVSLHLPWGGGLPEFEEVTPELLDQMERTLLEMLEQASFSLSSYEVGLMPDWQGDVFAALRRECLPLTDSEGDHYGPER